MIKWHDPLFIGEKAKKNKDRLVKGIEEGKILLLAYAIILPKNPKSQLEIIQATQLKQPFYKKNEVEIVGIAASKEEAIDVVAEITTRAIKECGDADIRRYLERGDAV